jgi:uncharacterized protein YjcR
MTNKQKKALAEMLFVRGGVSNQTELAEKVGVRPATITKWKKEGGWDKLRKSLLVTRQQQLAFLYDQVDELSQAIRKKEPGQRYANSKEGDIYAKLTTSIAKLETEVSVAEIVTVQMQFSEFIASADLAHAQMILEYQDAFIKSRL